MLSLTRQALDAFDNSHEFERMAADILNKLGCSNVTPIAPNGGADDGKDIEYKSPSGENGLVLVSLRKDVKAKFYEDISKHSKDDYSEYTFFTNRQITATQKKEFRKYCVDSLEAHLVFYDAETLRSLLDSSLHGIRQKYLHISKDDLPEYEMKLVGLQKYSADTVIADAQQRLMKAQENVAQQNQIARNNPFLRVSDITRIAQISGGAKPADVVLDNTQEYVQSVGVFANQLQNIISFNLEVLSNMHDENISIEITSVNGEVIFSFDEDLITPPETPQTHYSNGLFMSHNYMPNFNQSGKNEFYAELADSDTMIRSTLIEINPYQSKYVIDEELFVKITDKQSYEEHGIKLRIAIYSRNLSSGPIINELCIPSSKEITESKLVPVNSGD